MPRVRKIPSVAQPLGDLAYVAVSEELPTGAIVTLLEFARNADEDGITLTSVRGVARDRGLSSGTVARQVDKLVELEFLEKLGRTRSDHRRYRWRVAGMGAS
jgi:DNA-binding MarR family transcriptional regulator